MGWGTLQLLMLHDTQMMQFIAKQRAEFVETKTRIGS